VRLITLLLILWLTVLPCSAQPGNPSAVTAVREDFYARKFGQGIEDYKRLPPEVQNTPVASFWAAQCYMRRHQFLAAEPLLRIACEGDLREPQRTVAIKLHERVERLKALCPPLDGEYGASGASIRVYARKTPWAGSITLQMPRFLARARQAFGEPLPAISFYLFEERTTYDAFYTSMASTENSTGHRGTGSYHMVLFCQFFLNGNRIGDRDPGDLFARVLHEYGHALCSTSYGDRYHDQVPQWLNEGLADAFASIYSEHPHARASSAIQRAKERRQPPTYEELCHDLYSDGRTGYAMGDLMVEEILKNQDISALGRLIKTARGDDGDFESAIRKVTGKDAQAVFQHVMTTHWNGK
jgi:hypothetical protein